MRCHFVPRHILRRFVEGNSGLYELDKLTGWCGVRAVAEAGQFPDFYTAELEHGILEDLDTEADAILRDRIVDKDSVHLTDIERRAFARWVASVFLRSPRVVDSHKRWMEYGDANPAAVVKDIEQHLDEAVEAAKRYQPDVWNYHVARVGEEAARRLVVEHAKIVAYRTRAGKWKDPMSHKELFCKLVGDQALDSATGAMLSFNWQWIRTAEEFVVGDHPVTPWYAHPHRRELTIPLSKTLTLRLTRAATDPLAVLIIDKKATAALNLRQLFNATRKVYGPRDQIRREANHWKAERSNYYARIDFPGPGVNAPNVMTPEHSAFEREKGQQLATLKGMMQGQYPPEAFEWRCDHLDLKKVDCRKLAVETSRHIAENIDKLPEFTPGPRMGIPFCYDSRVAGGRISATLRLEFFNKFQDWMEEQLTKMPPGSF
jgi:hypothetical protein